jgi:4-amino-4-deoxy-L-arabinose transferase-like glycosyltransferase
LGRWLLDGTAAGLVVLLGVATVASLSYQLLALGHRFPLDYGEAPLVDQAMRLAAGQNIYRPDLSAAPYTISNYPPVYVAVLALFTALGGPGFGAGRLVSSVCAWVAAACLGFIIYRHSRDRLAAVATGLVFLTIPYVTYWSGFLRVDMLALALCLSALAVLVRWPASRRSLLAAGLLLVAAIFTRQSYALAGPLAAFVWLLASGPNGWRRALGLAALVGGLALALFLLLQVITGGGFFFNIVTANVNEYRPDILERNARDLYETAWPLLLLAGVSLLLIRRWNPLYTLAAPFLVGGALSALTIGKVGSNVNYLLELSAGLSLAAGVVFLWAKHHLRWQVVAAAVLVLLAAQTALSLRAALFTNTEALNIRQGLNGELHELQGLVAESEGPVLADEYMGMSTLAGQPLYLQPFETTQLAAAGLWDQTPLVESITNQAFELILLYDRPWSRERWTAEELAAIEASYRLTDRLAETRVYRPSRNEAVVAAEACPTGVWRLPTGADRGVQGEANGLLFFGEGAEGGIPVYAVADGLLWRPLDLVDAVAIEHDDPLQPGEKVWTYYADLVTANGLDAHIVDAFPLGSAGVPVKAGEVIGYQGTWGGRPNWPRWVHARFAIVRQPEVGAYPNDLTREFMLDPAPYLGLPPELTAESRRVQTFACAAQP